MALRGVLLDVDGTLVDSNDLHARAWVDAFREFGRDVPYEKVRRLIGMGGDNLLPEAAGLSKDDSPGEELAERRSAIFKERYLEKVRPFPRVRELLEKMRGAGLDLAVASSAQRDELKTLLDIAGVADLIESKTSASDAENSKPDPDIILAALRRLGCEAGEALMVGDTPYDIEAAGKAGVKTVAFRCGGWDDAGLKGAIAVYDSPADLEGRFASSPFAER